MDLQRTVPWGRDLEEYLEMFSLSALETGDTFIGCGDGPASFNAEATSRNIHVTSVDPLYAFSKAGSMITYGNQSRTRTNWNIAVCTPCECFSTIMMRDAERDATSRQVYQHCLFRITLSTMACAPIFCSCIRHSWMRRYTSKAFLSFVESLEMYAYSLLFQSKTTNVRNTCLLYSKR